MAIIRFLSQNVDVTVRVEASAGEGPTVLSVAREHDIPLPFRCETGDCTACLVHVETRCVGNRPVQPITDKERSTLQSVFLLSPHDIEEAERRGTSPDVRLACQYAVADEDISVFFEAARE